MPALLTGAPLRPRYPLFPETKALCANVLCEGPSILRVTRQDLLPGPVVAVNHALALSDRLPVDFWATVDDPKLLWDWSELHRPEGFKLFTTENNSTYWLDLLGEEAFNEKAYAWQPTFMEHLGTPEQKAPVLPTVIPVLAWLSHVGCEHVRLFGCDMTGQNSHLSELPYSSEEDEGWEYRWAIERQLISICHKKYRARGKRLERWGKARSNSRNLLSLWSRMQRPAS